MSHFICNITQVDSPHGYISGCCHHPPEHSRYVKVFFGGDDEVPTLAYCKGGVWYRSQDAERQGRAVHPVRWEAVSFAPDRLLKDVNFETLIRRIDNEEIVE